MRSDTIKRGIDRAPHRALFRATGVCDADMSKPFVALVNSKRRLAEQEHPIEQVGMRLRAMIPFLDPVVVKPGVNP